MLLFAASCFFSIPTSLNLGQRRRKKEGWRVLKLAYGILRALHDGIGGPMLYTLRFTIAAPYAQPCRQEGLLSGQAACKPAVLQRACRP